MLVHRRVTPSINVSDTHLYTLVEGGTVIALCLAQEHNTMSLGQGSNPDRDPEKSVLTIRPLRHPRSFIREMVNPVQA